MSVYEQRLSLRIAPDAWHKLWLYISLADGEVGGLATVEMAGSAERDFLMTDCFLIEQRATDVDTELDPAATSRFLLDMLAGGGDPALLRLWWHSHAREGVFWSSDDERTIDGFGGEWLISLVGNLAGRFLARFDRYEPRRETLGWVDVIPPGPPPAARGELAARVQAELGQRVRMVHRHTNKLWTDGDLPERHG